MKLRTKLAFSILCILALFMGVNGLAGAAPSAISISGISPTEIQADTPTEIEIRGAGFDSQAIVVLSNGTIRIDFSPVFESATSLSVTVSVPAGEYRVYVVNSTSDFAYFDSLVVTAAPPADTPTPPAFVRPQLVVNSYKASVSQVQSGTEFKLYLGIGNPGTATALNVQATFASADLVPTKTGGVSVVGTIPMGGSAETSQTFLAVDSLYGKSVVVIDVTLSYYDDGGVVYSDKFTLSVPAGGGAGTTYATATPTGVKSAQLVITSYTTSIDPLQPGETFELTMTVENMGNTAAKGVVMIVGGGSAGDSSGTPQPGGVSGGNGEFTNFAPVGASNIQSLGDLSPSGKFQVKQKLIVNVSTAPGAYPMKISFSYVTDNGEVINDDQVITLLVYSLPRVDISFYRDPGVFLAGQPNNLPIQVVNLGKRTAVLGNMSLSANNGILETESTLVGSLDAGGYFTFDGSAIPDAAGPLQVTLTIEYTDDFNQPRTITKTFDLTVEEGFMDPSMEPGMEDGSGEAIVQTEETFLQKVWRFILGLVGLDSSPSPSDQPLEGVPGEEMPIPVQPGGGKG